MSGRTLAIVPARGGSKRVPRKNVRTVGGKPLIAHALDHARSAQRVDEAIVSTDDDEIAAVAREHGGVVPFVRPDELASDTASMSGTITHALEWKRERGETYDAVCVLQTTCPLRTAEDVDGTLERLAATDANSAISIAPYLTPPQWAVTEDDKGLLHDSFGTGALWATDPDRSQDLSTQYRPNGAVFAATTDAWNRHETFYTDRTAGYVMPPERSFDIDEPWELRLVETLLE